MTSFIKLLGQESDYEKECRIIDGYINSGDFDGGITYLKQKIAIYDSSESLLDTNYSFYQLELGKMYYYIGEFKPAEKAILKSINFDRELVGEKSADCLTGMSVLSNLYREMGFYEKSLSITNQLSSLYNQIEITDSASYESFLNNTGVLYFSIGNLSKAEEYLMQAKILGDKIYDENSSDKTPLLNNLGSLYKELGQYSKAEKTFLEMMKINLEYYGKHHTFVAEDYNNLGDLYGRIGNTAQAEKQFILAKEIYEFKNDKKLGYIYVLNNLALIYFLKNDLAKAELICTDALKIAQTLVGKSHHINTSLLSRLSIIYYSKKDYKHTITTLAESIGILKSLNPDHINLVTQLHNMGNAYCGITEYDSAELVMREAARIAGSHYPKYHKDYVKSLNALAEILYNKKDVVESKSLFIESMDLFCANISKNFDFLSSIEKEKYLSVLKSNLHRFNSFATDYYGTENSIAGEMFDYNLFMKGIIFTSLKKMKEFGFRDTSQVEFRRTYDKWIRTKEYLAKVYSLTKSEIEWREISIDSIQDVANTLEKQLTMESAVFSKHHSGKRHSWMDIKKGLNRDEAFVQIVRFPQAGSIIYAALIVSANDVEHPQMILLHDDGAKVENDQYESYITNLTNGYYSNDKYSDTEAYYNFWERIENLVSDKKTVYLMPDGVYNKINVAALMMETGEFVYEKHKIVLLTSINDFVDPVEAVLAKANTAVLIGVPDFSMGCRGESMIAGELMDVPDDNQKLRSQILTPIPLSGTEVRYIDSLLNRFSWKTQLFINQNATEEMVKNLRSPEVLHISTHGFFNTLNHNLENRGTVQLPETDFTAAMNPLFCSGLYLAGAQNSLNGNYLPDEYSEDGILTAYEVANLNLDSTRLVVLSACETGLGEILSGEGVFGLQRAFRVAGAENLIMSLWKVDDRATQLFMKKFYTFWLSGDTKSEAFDKAISFLRFNTQDYTHPVYWGGFVLLGNEQPNTKHHIGIVIISLSIITIILLAMILRFRKKTQTGMFTF